MKRIAIISIFSFLILISSFVVWNWTMISHFPEALPSFHSKEMCSCLFVAEQSEDYCRDLVQHWIPIQGDQVDYKSRQVTARGLGVTRSAHFVSERFGCQLD